MLLIKELILIADKINYLEYILLFPFKIVQNIIE